MLRIKKSIFEECLLVIFWICMFPIDSIGIVAGWKIIHLVFQCLFILFVIYVVAIMFARREFPPICVFFGGVLVYYVFNSFIQDGNVYLTKIIKLYMSITIIAYIVHLYAHKNSKILIKSLYIYFSLMVYINAFFMYKYPEGLVKVRTNRLSGIIAYNRCHFLGVDNRLVMWFILALLLSVICKEKSVIKKLNDLALVASIIIQITTVWSATGIIGTFIMVGLCYFVVPLNRKWLSVSRVIVIYSLSSLGVIGFKIQIYFTEFIEEILKKSVDFSKRVEIWEGAIELIKQKPLFGYGYANNGGIIVANNGIWYAHNLILDMFIQGGIALVVAYYFLFFQINKEINRQVQDHYTKACIAALLAILITAITESYLANIHFYFILIITYYSCKFE